MDRKESMTEAKPTARGMSPLVEAYLASKLTQQEFRAEHDMSVGGAIVGDTSRYMLIWERQADGFWLVAYDIWNSALPVDPSD